MRKGKIIPPPVRSSSAIKRSEGGGNARIIPAPTQDDLDKNEPPLTDARQHNKRITSPEERTTQHPSKTREAIEALDRALSTSSWSSDSF